MSEDLRLSVAEVEKLFGKSVEELLKNPENRTYLAEILSDAGIKEALKMSPNMQLSPQERKLAERWLVEYGRQPTLEETMAKGEENVRKFEEARKNSEEAQKIAAASKKELEQVAELKKSFQKIEEIGKKSRLDSIKYHYDRINDYRECIAELRKKINKTTDPEKIADLTKWTSKMEKYTEESRESIERNYEGLNPELAALRKEEREKVQAGMDPKQATKERREAVKAYYNKKSSRDM